MSFVLEYEDEKGEVERDYIVAKVGHYFLKGERTMKNLSIKFIGHLNTEESLHLMFLLKRNDESTYSDDSETLDRMVEDIVGDSLGIKLSMWGETLEDLYEYMSRVLKEYAKEDEMIRSVTLFS